MGGEAVANYDSVVEGAKIVKTAIDTWGRIDIVINNGQSFSDLSAHWSLVLAVHRPRCAASL